MAFVMSFKFLSFLNEITILYIFQLCFIDLVIIIPCYLLCTSCCVAINISIFYHFYCWYREYM